MEIIPRYKVGDLLYYKHPMDNFSVFGRIIRITDTYYIIKWDIGSITENPFEGIDNDMCTRIASSTEIILYGQN